MQTRRSVVDSYLPRQILADQALEEGRHGVALGLYRASLATPPLPPSPPSSRCPPHVAADADVVNSRKSPPGVSDGCAANQREESAAEAPGAAAAEASPDATTAVVGDALHGVGVALLAAGKFRGACRAWERYVPMGGGALAGVRGMSTTVPQARSRARVVFAVHDFFLSL